VTAEELAALHPRLFHVTTPGAWPSIAAQGLLSSAALLARLGVAADRAAALTTRRREAEVPVQGADGARAVLNDNLPLSEAALAKCLDDGLSPAEWLAMLNARVFFWADEAGLARLLGARMNRGRAREVLVVDTLGLARTHAARMELCPINSGATICRPARRGRNTFTPLGAMGYREWRRRRGGMDRIIDVTVRGGVPDIARHVIERREVRAA
jgi:hypothetical protein